MPAACFVRVGVHVHSPVRASQRLARICPPPSQTRGRATVRDPRSASTCRRAGRVWQEAVQGDEDNSWDEPLLKTRSRGKSGRVDEKSRVRCG